MTIKDYKKLGLKCGLEIHQQLDTDKLFMYSPSIIRDDTHDYEIRRRLRAVSGESGEKDAAALFEESSRKTFVYQGYYDTISSIELDEEPPRVMNADALTAVLQVSSLLDASIVDEVQVMRKTVVDGSNTSGFQRTSLVGRNGSIRTDYGNVGVPTISIEEDSAKIVSRDQEKGEITYNLSRLGIPLIEIGTDPDIKTPEMARDVAAKLGMILRSTGKVKRGLGTIRQDLNVSITGGSRIEIKGAQDLRMIPTWIDNEILRQQKLIAIKDWLNKKKAKVDRKITDVSSFFKNTSSKMISSEMKKGNVAKAVRLNKFSGALGEEINPDRRVGTELSDYVKISSGLKGIIHSDENMEKYGISDSEYKNLSKQLSLGKDDAFIMILGEESKTQIALEAVLDRADLLLSCIPKEVRRANQDGTTSFMRPMPGSSRMYPETDCVPVPTRDMLANIEIPELIEHKKKRYETDFGISSDLAEGVSKFDYGKLPFSGFHSFDDIVRKYDNLEPSFIAQALLNYPKEVKKRLSIEFVDDNYREVFTLLDNINAGEITKSAFMEILPKMIKKEEIDYSRYRPLDESKIKERIKEIVSDNRNAPRGALMGMCMKEFRGSVDGKKISDLLAKEIEDKN